MYPENIPLSSTVQSDIRRYLASNLKKISSSRHLINLLKNYLEEQDETKRQLLAEEIMLGIEGKE
jgi:hypothetical protein